MAHLVQQKGDDATTAIEVREVKIRRWDLPGLYGYRDMSTALSCLHTAAVRVVPARAIAQLRMR
jgi:hypothetical protein